MLAEAEEDVPSYLRGVVMVMGLVYPVGPGLGRKQLLADKDFFTQILTHYYKGLQ